MWRLRKKGCSILAQGYDEKENKNKVGDRQLRSFKLCAAVKGSIWQVGEMDTAAALVGNTLGQAIGCESGCHHLKCVTLGESPNCSGWIWWAMDKFTLYAVPWICSSSLNYKFARSRNLLLLLLLRPLFQLLLWARGNEPWKEVGNELRHSGILEW